MPRLIHSAVAMFLVVGVSVTTSVFAQGAGDADQPTALLGDTTPLEDVAWIVVPPIDFAAVRDEDLDREQDGLPPRYAIPNRVMVTPVTHGTWEDAGAGRRVWRLRILAPRAHSLNLGFTRYVMPAGGRLLVYSGDYGQVIRAFTDRDNEPHGQLWTPVVRSDDVVVEVTIPAAARQGLELELTHIGYGYRGFGGPGDGGPVLSGACNVDVVCPEGDGWRGEIPSVAVISTGGSTFCTGFMVNNTSYDETPYFMTARHCGIGSGNAASLVVYWNYENSWCRPPGSGQSGQPGDGSLSDFQTGSFHRSTYAPSDFTLVELDEAPNPDWGVSFAGWDRSGDDATSAVAIHHPATDEKRISFEDDPTTTTSYLGNSIPGDGTHVRVTDWDLGTTEPGSSGSPLFDQNHRVIGQLHGGYASCSSQTSDWYGKFSVSWSGGGNANSRLSDWLDPGNTGELAVDTISGAGMSVSPSGAVEHAGPVGGPFSNPVTIYTLSNTTTEAIDYEVRLGAGTAPLLIDGGTDPVLGTLPANVGEAAVTVTLDRPEMLPAGVYSREVVFDDLTNDRQQLRLHTIEVGKVLAYSFPLDSDPGWTISGGQWAFGQPTGGGGQHGNRDPVSGHTGANVYGYNLGGDYGNNIPQYHLTTTALDCTGLLNVELKFWRWLNVEQPAYDHAYVRVSNNGTTWSTIWENASEITDSSWSQQAFDISAVADDQPTVYLRWTMGTTDGSWQYSGWNVDDVEIWGITTAPTETICPDDPNDFLRSFGGPVTGDALDLCGSEDVRLEVLQAAQVSPLLPFISLEFWAHSTLADAAIASVQYTIEGHVSALVGGGQNADTLRTSIMNYNTGSWEQVDERGTASSTDEVITHTQSTNAPDYVNAGDGEVRVRQEVWDPGLVFSPNWFLKVDLYEVTVAR